MAEKQYQWITVPNQFITADGISFAYREYEQETENRDKEITISAYLA